MSKKNQAKQGSFFQKYPRFKLTLILFLIVFPVLLISSLHFYQAVIVKPVLFENKDFKLTKKQNHFQVEAELIEIKKATENTPEKYVFDYKITQIGSTNPKTVKNIKGQLSTKFHNYNSNSVSVSTRMESTSYQKLEISYEFNNKVFFPLLKSKLPELYIRIDYTFYNDLTNLEESASIFVKVDYNISDQIQSN